MDAIEGLRGGGGRGWAQIRRPDLRYGGRSQLETDDKGKSGSLRNERREGLSRIAARTFILSLRDTCITLIC